MSENNVDLNKYVWSSKKIRNLKEDLDTLKNFSNNGYAPKIEGNSAVKSIRNSCKDGFYKELGITWTQLILQAGLSLKKEGDRNISSDLKLVKQFGRNGKPPSTKCDPEINRIYRSTLRGQYKKQGISWKDLLAMAGFL